MNRDNALLLDILTYAKRACAFNTGVTWELFSGDLKLQQATQYSLLVIGEAAGKLSAEFRASHPRVPWSKLIALRHRLAHDYPGIESPKIWAIVREDLGGLIAAIEPLILPSLADPAAGAGHPATGQT